MTIFVWICILFRFSNRTMNTQSKTSSKAEDLRWVSTLSNKNNTVWHSYAINEFLSHDCSAHDAERDPEPPTTTTVARCVASTFYNSIPYLLARSKSHYHHLRSLSFLSNYATNNHAYADESHFLRLSWRARWLVAWMRVYRNLAMDMRPLVPVHYWGSGISSSCYRASINTQLYAPFGRRQKLTSRRSREWDLGFDCMIALIGCIKHNDPLSMYARHTILVNQPCIHPPNMFLLLWFTLAPLFALFPNMNSIGNLNFWTLFVFSGRGCRQWPATNYLAQFSQRHVHLAFPLLCSCTSVVCMYLLCNI